MYVGDVKDRSNTLKGCNAMYVGDFELDQIHLRAVISYVCRRCRRQIHLFQECNAIYVEDVEDGKRTYTVLAQTSLILNGFSIRRSKFWKADLGHFSTIQILCILKIYYDLRHLRHK